MRPALSPGDGLLALRGGEPSARPVTVFRDPTMSSRWLVKRVGDVYRRSTARTFEARSDNPNAPGAVDSHEFGWVPASGSYRVVWTVRGTLTTGMRCQNRTMSARIPSSTAAMTPARSSASR